LLATFLILNTLTSGKAIGEDFARNIQIPTLCGEDGTRNGTCPSDRGTCSINPLANNIWTTEAFCVCKPGFYGNECQYGPLCNDTNECSGKGKCGVHQLTNGTFVEKCVCDSGYFGDDCSNNPCLNVTCDNNGTCSSVSIPDGTFSFYCKCPTSHFGNKCQYEKDTFGDDNRIANGSSSSAPSQAAPRACPLDKGYKLYGNDKYCYRLSTDPLTWTDAKQTCEGDDTYLAEIGSQDEFDTIKSLIPASYEFRWVSIIITLF